MVDFDTPHPDIGISFRACNKVPLLGARAHVAWGLPFAVILSHMKRFLEPFLPQPCYDFSGLRI